MTVGFPGPVNPLARQGGAMGVAVVLLSGGVDSMATAAVLQRAGQPVRGLFVNYGQPAAAREWSAAEAIAGALGMAVERRDLAELCPPDIGSMPGRNGLLLHIALHLAGPGVNAIALGVHAGSRYPDCGVPFLRACQRLLDIYTAGTVAVVAPFADMTKEDIWLYCRSENLPIDLTYSCERGLDQPCLDCPSCHDRRRLATSA